ncbi:dihydrodipicolinate synthase family protein [Actinopolymorpha pittospori]|uniref:4-hydroxy-tetrahydrodipicolinate synthase n=1 Tax=Actinopolymorpha pittospori TaxID=648752 RepID=A0A927N0M9_9ACTN|nr:dihydrodipicolinate synthase family protein [Actinopolymorpha pittospori]MBE1606550.1 4-hydroxy-tetrahydrodipicolinate synthase [Actinopolymorpha pittospori]
MSTRSGSEGSGAALSGVVPPLVTPLTPDCDVDVPSLARLIDHLLGAGVAGVFVLGTSGEGTFLTDDQRRRVLDTTVAHVAGAVPVLSGIIDASTYRARALLDQALQAGVDAVVACAPFYAGTHPAEIERHFRYLSERAGDTPLYAYDIPVRVNGTKLTSDSLVRLGQEGVLAGVKDSSGSDASLRRVLLDRADAGVPGFAVMTGSEISVDVALALGVDGVVPGLGNVDPAGYVRIFEAMTKGDLETARAEQNRLFRLFDIVKVADRGRMGPSSAALGAFKAGLYLRGVISCPVTMFPSIPLSDDEIEGVRAHLVTAGLL